MINWLFGRRASSASKPAHHVPSGSRIYAIGDIHGRADLLADLLELIKSDAENAPSRRVLVYLGDYVDRGLNSREVVEQLILKPLAGFEVVHIKGNHEAALLDFLVDARIGPNWLQFGGGATLLSYRVGLVATESGGTDFISAQQEFAERLPSSHLKFYRNLVLTHEEGDYVFVHAGVRPGIPLGEQKAEDLMWIRDEFLDYTGDFGKVVVHGHTITDEPEVCDNRIGIDTGAFATGRLTCLVLEGNERRFLFT
jgi:serine/threonine protein phosphatase 1